MSDPTKSLRKSLFGVFAIAIVISFTSTVQLFGPSTASTGVDEAIEKALTLPSLQGSHYVTINNIETIQQQRVQEQIKTNLSVSEVAIQQQSPLPQSSSSSSSSSFSSATASFVRKNWTVEDFEQRIQAVPTLKNTRDQVWWENIVEPFSRVYPSFSKEYPWCIPEPFPSPWELPNNTAVAKGLLYVKVYKTSSSTCQGVNEQIAHQVAKRLNYNVPCIHYNRHEFADARGQGKRSMDETSILWSFVRHPSKRDVSQYFHFRVSRMGFSGNNTDKMIELMRSRMRAKQTKYMLPSYSIENRVSPRKLNKPDNIQEALQIMDRYIFQHYDFIGTAERTDESLAVMVVLWNLDITDVIVLSAKQAGKSMWDVRKGFKFCEKLTPSFVLPPVKEYLQNEHMFQNADYLLYYVADRSLTKTIEYIGVDKIATIVKQIKYLRNLAEEHCQQYAHHPCSSTGQLQWHLAKESCYEEDSGCAHKCVMELLEPYMNQKTEIPIN